MSEKPVADFKQREQALDPRHSFIVQAPAGSGKTELLVQRFLRLLGTVENPEEIVAITFTRKAAAEMRKRVLEGLAHTDKLRWPLEDIGQRLRIHTIDALCAALTRQMPVLAKFGAQPEIVEDARELYREAARRALALLEKQDLAAAHVGRLLMHLDGNVEIVEGLIVGMLARRDLWLRNTGEARNRDELEAALNAERERLVANARALFPGRPPGDVDAWQQLAQSLLTKADHAWRKRPPAPPELVGNEPLRGALAALFSMPPARYTETQWEALGAIVALLPRATAELKLVFGEHGKADFTEIAQGAVRALGNADVPTDLLLSLDVRVQHILVDEFQDTSISQQELLERLTAGWEAGDGRTLFLVGDPMQSIYRFRAAEVGIFLHARHHGIGGVHLEPLALRTNFRSQAGIVEWVNDAFQNILPREEDETTGAVPYAGSESYHPLELGAAVCWHCFFDGNKEVARAAEAQCIVEIIAARREQNPKAKIAILVRNRTSLERVVPALKQAAMRFRAIEIERLGEKQVVQDLFALARVLAHPADRIAWLALLRAPWCGLTLADLDALASICSPSPLMGEGRGEGDRTIWELINDDTRAAALSVDGCKRLARVREVIDTALAQRLRGGLRARIEGLWFALGGPACIEDTTDLEDAGIFLDHLEANEEAGDIADLTAFEESLKELYALPDVNAGDDAIEIMTIHKAKGLEFDTVILPGLDRVPGKSEPPLLVWKERPDGTLLLAPAKETGEKQEPIYDYVGALEKEAEDNEAGRLLYVAATRAQSRLHLLARAGVDREGAEAAVKPPAKRSLLAKAWPVAQTAFEESLKKWTPSSCGPVPAPAHTAAGALTRLTRSFVLPGAPAPVNRSVRNKARDMENAIEFFWAGETARHVGSVAHRWLQSIAEEELKGWDSKRIVALHRIFGSQLAARGVPENELDAAVRHVTAALTHAVTDERGRWLLGPQQDACNERRITAIIDGERMNLVIDRMFLDTDGKRWIVDYKTGGHEGADVEEFLDRERERYQAQLERYAAAVGGGQKPMLALYFPLLAGWREWRTT